MKLDSILSERVCWVYDTARDWLKNQKCSDISVSCGEGTNQTVFQCHKIMVRAFLEQNLGVEDYEEVEVVIMPELSGVQFRQYLNYVYGFHQEQIDGIGYNRRAIEEILSLGSASLKIKLDEEQHPEQDESSENQDTNEDPRDDSSSPCSIVRKSAQCQECKKIFINEGKLKQHFLKSHPELEFISSRNRRKVSSYGSTFHSEAKLYEHKEASIEPGGHSLVTEAAEASESESLAVTISIKKSERTWPCLLCSQVFKVQRMAKEHMLEVHWVELKEKGMLFTKNGSPTITTICCDYENCSRYFRDKADKEQHMSSFHRKERNHVCHICSKAFMGRKSLRNHIDMKHSQVDEEILCTDCGSVFQNKAKLKYHQTVAHKEKVRKYSCRFCAYKSYAKPQLKEHERIHTGEKPEICSWCGQGFSSKKTLINHERLHTGEKPYKCKYCDSSFVQRTSLNVHVQTHHKEHAGGKSLTKAKNYMFSRGDIEAGTELHHLQSQRKAMTSQSQGGH